MMTVFFLCRKLVNLCGYFFDLAVMSHAKATDDMGKRADVFVHVVSVLEAHISSQEELTADTVGDVWIQLADKLAHNLKEVVSSQH